MSSILLRRLALLVLSAGCNQFFGLSKTQLVDARFPDVPDAPPDAPDGDIDGVPDAIDNCPTLSNGDQSDVDRDGVGDLCDNCPLIANPYQEHAGDNDAVGDACDPYPVQPAECLVLFDSFHDATTLASGWDVLTKSGSPNVDTSTPSHMLVTPPADTFGVIFESKLATTSRFHVQLIGSVKITGGQVMVASNYTLSQGYTCDLEPNGSIIAAEKIVMHDGTSAPSVTMSSLPVNDRLTIRLQNYVVGATGQSPMGCRIDHGVAIGNDTIGNPVGLAGGTVAFVVIGDPAEIDAVAIYESTMTTCPTPIYR